jgi:hypothetical protein
MDSIRDLLLDLWTRNPRATERRVQQELEQEVNKIVNKLVVDITTTPENWHSPYAMHLYTADWLLEWNTTKGMDLMRGTQFATGKREQHPSVFKTKVAIPLTWGQKRKLKKAAAVWGDLYLRKRALEASISTLEQLVIINQDPS